MIINSNAVATLRNTTNSYNGLTSVVGGSTLKNGVDNALPTGSALSVGDSSTVGTYDLNGQFQSLLSVQLINGSIIGTGDTLVSSSTYDVQSGSVGVRLSGNVGLIKTTPGTVALNGVNSYNGLTQVAGGTLAVNGKVAGALTVGAGGTLAGSGIVGGAATISSGGILAPGNSAGSMSIGSLTLQAGSQALIELGGTSRGNQYDSILTTGLLTIGGTLNVSLINGFNPTAGQSFDVLDWGSRSGTFTSIVLPVLSVGKTWDTSGLYTSGVLSVVGSSITGDFDGDGDIDGADFIAWQTNFPTPDGGTRQQGDADGDGDVDGGDFMVWQGSFPQGAGPANTPVPEPHSCWICAIGGVMAWWLRREGKRNRPERHEIKLQVVHVAVVDVR
jgi:autotransporter-associated beta strand protein